MKRCLILLLCFGLLVPTTANASGGVELTTEHHRNVVDRVVQLQIQNYEQDPIELMGSWTISDVRSGEQVSHYDYSEDEKQMGPGEVLVWEWPQDDACYGICRNVQAGEPVGPGVYEAAIETSLGVFTHRFHIGQYFTIGFTSRPNAKFIVYVNSPDEVAAMSAQAAGQADKQIVSGIVRRGKRYNPDWNFTMGPGSIVLGDVFMEVCDGSPYYVQRHRRDWLGDRWCPWSSYVEKVGR